MKTNLIQLLTEGSYWTIGFIIPVRLIDKLMVKLNGQFRRVPDMGN